MKLTRCPICHHEISLESLVQDEAGKELLSLVAKMQTQTASSCLSYLGLFRPSKSHLNNGRALRLLSEILVLTPNQTALCQAIDQTVVQISQNRQNNGDTKPLNNHNYLKKVLTSISGWDVPQGANNALIARPTQTSKQSISQALGNTADTSWINT